MKMGKNDENRGIKVKSKVISLLALSCLFFVLTQPMYSNVSGRDIVIIFDASGSMEEITSSGESKVDVAKDAVDDFLDKLTSMDRAALIVFYDCEIIQVEATFTYSHSSVAATVQSIEPYDDTPIGDSLSYAWEYLKDYGDRSHLWYIVIFTDGEETCNGDPCYVANVIASEASSYGETPIYTVGFLIDPDSQAEEDLECIALATGGQYFPASSSDDLGDVFERIAEDITDSGGLEEIYVYIVTSIALLGALLLIRTMFFKHGEKIEYEHERRRKRFFRRRRPPKEETAILWGATEEERDEEYTGGEFVDW